MKSKILLFVLTLLVSAGLATMQSCKQEESLVVEYGAFTQPKLVAPANDAYVTVPGTTLTLSWASTDTEGDPDNWDIYFGTSSEPALVKRHHNSQTYTVTVTKGQEYYWRVVGTDANGIPTSSETWSFIVLDPAAALAIDMTWTTDVEKSIGLSLDPDEVVDLRLLILKESDRSEVAVEDGSSFETFSDFNSLPDGSYLVATDIYSTINAGDFNAPVTLDINLAFSKPGTIDLTLPFPKVMDNLMPCSDYFTILAKVVKVGNNYTITKNVAYAWSASLAKLAGTWHGIDNFEYETQIVTTVDGSELKIDGMGFEWLSDFWGETIQTHTPVPVTIDWNSSGNFTIEDQYFLTTLYEGDLYDYNIVGSGSFITCGEYPVMILEFDLVQDGFSTGTWLYKNKYAPTKYFTTTITLDPAGKGALNKSTSKGFVKPIFVKPY